MQWSLKRRAARVLWAHAALLSVLGAAPPVLADADTTVGIVVSLRVGVDQATADRLADALGDALHSHYEVEVISGARARSALPKELPASCLAEPSCIRDIATRLGVTELLFLSMVSTSSQSVQIDSTWVDAKTAAAASRAMMEVDPRGPGKTFAGAGLALIPNAPVRPRRPAPKPAPVPVAAAAPEQQRGISAQTWVTLGVTGASAATAVTFALLARREFNRLDVSCPQSCDTDTLETRSLLADVFFGATLVAAGATTFLYLRDRSRARRRPALSLTGDTDRIGVAVFGAF